MSSWLNYQYLEQCFHSKFKVLYGKRVFDQETPTWTAETLQRWWTSSTVRAMKWRGSSRSHSTSSLSSQRLASGVANRFDAKSTLVCSAFQPTYYIEKIYFLNSKFFLNFHSLNITQYICEAFFASSLKRVILSNIYAIFYSLIHKQCPIRIQSLKYNN